MKQTDWLLKRIGAGDVLPLFPPHLGFIVFLFNCNTNVSYVQSGDSYQIPRSAESDLDSRTSMARAPL